MEPELAIVKGLYFRSGDKTFRDKNDLIAHFIEGMVPDDIEPGRSMARGFDYYVGLGYWIVENQANVYSTALHMTARLLPIRGPYATHLEAAQALVALLRERDTKAA